MDLIGLSIQTDSAGAAQNGGVDDNTRTVGGLDEGIRTRRDLAQLSVDLMLVFEAAHQTATGTRDLGRVEREILLLCHVDGNRLEVIQKGRAAQRAAADTQTTEHLSLVAHTDLAQLDAGAEDRGEILDEITEVDAAVGGEIKQHLV